MAGETDPPTFHAGALAFGKRRNLSLPTHVLHTSGSWVVVFWACRSQVTALSVKGHTPPGSVAFPAGPHVMSESLALIHQQALGGNVSLVWFLS